MPNQVNEDDLIIPAAEHDDAPASAALLQLYNRAFDEFRAVALWNVERVEGPTRGEVRTIAPPLRASVKPARALAERIERTLNADL